MSSKQAGCYNTGTNNQPRKHKIASSLILLLVALSVIFIFLSTTLFESVTALKNNNIIVNNNLNITDEGTELDIESPMNCSRNCSKNRTIIRTLNGSSTLGKYCNATKLNDTLKNIEGKNFNNTINQTNNSSLITLTRLKNTNESINNSNSTNRTIPKIRGLSSFNVSNSTSKQSSKLNELNELNLSNMSKTNISSSSSRNKTSSDVEFNNITPITTKLNLSFVFGGDALNTSSMENSAEQYECYVEILAKNNTVKKAHAKVNSKINLYINSTNTIENLTLKFEFKVNKSYKATIIIYGLNPKQAIHQGIYQEKNIVNITNTMNNTYNITDNITVKTKNESISTNKTITNYTINVINQNLIGLKPFRQQLIMNYYGRLPEGISKITPIFAFDDKAYNFSQAKIVLPKNNLRVDYILHCTDWNFTTQVCYSWEVKKPSYYNGFGENKTHFWFYTKHFDSYTAGDAVDLKVENISFNTTNPIEGQNITVTVNVSNTGNASIDSVELQLNISLWNGTAWVLKHSEEKNTSIGINDSNTTDFYWTAVPGTYKFNAYVDPYDSFIETNESNNQLSKNYTVPEWQIFYGQVNNKLLLADSSLNNFTIWTGLFGNIYLADSDFSVNFSALKPLNGTDDLIEADDALNITGFNDSIKALWDRDGNNIADKFDNFTIRNRVVFNVPVVNSTNSSNFETGLLWDSSTGDSSSEYDGSQYLVIVTKIKNDLQGKYGVYDYEVRVPSALKKQVGTNELVTFYSD